MKSFTSRNRCRDIKRIIVVISLIVTMSCTLTGCQMIKEILGVQNEEVNSTSNMEYTITLKQWNEYSRKWGEITRTGVYSGQLVKGIPEGEGTFKAINDQGESWSYTGEFSEGTFSGYGKVEWNNGLCEEGTYTNGAYTPLEDELFCVVGTRSQAPFTITENNRRFIRENKDIFNSEKTFDYEALIDYSITPAMMKDNIENVEENLYCCIEASVEEIYENSMYGHSIAFVLARDYEGYLYVLVYDGELEDVVEQGIVTFTGLPVANSCFENNYGEISDAIVIVAADITGIW